MKNSIDVKINTKLFLAAIASISILSLAEYVSVPKSSGIDYISAVSSAELQEAESSIQIQIDELSKNEMPVGTVSMWGSETVPEGWLEMNGQSTSGYTELASIYGSTLPDLRGKFVRGWDNGEGVDEDSGRSLKSSQDFQMQKITGFIAYMISYLSNGNTGSDLASGAFYVSDNRTSTTSFGVNGSGADATFAMTFNQSATANSGAETRPVNIALMYIVKAK